MHQEIECMCAKTTQIPENNTFNTITQYPRLLTREGKIRCMRGTKSTRNNLIRNNLIHKVQCCQNKTYVYQFTLYLVFWETLNFMNGPSSNEKLKINLILYFLAIFLTKICHLPLVWPKAKNEISSYISHLIILMTRFLYVSHARMYGVSTFQLPMPVNHKLSNTNIWESGRSAGTLDPVPKPVNGIIYIQTVDSLNQTTSNDCPYIDLWIPGSCWDIIFQNGRQIACNPLSRPDI